MNVAYNVLLVISLIVAVAFALLIFVTGKGDAMSGSTAIRTTFKGKASIEDQISRLTLYLGISFMALMLILDILSNQIARQS